MSLKPPKKSDLGKSWMQTRRDKLIRIQPEYHLIVTEGEKTEPQYFNAIKKRINAQFRDKIQLDVKGTGDNTLSLFEYARMLASQNPNGCRHVWVVYDTDDFPAESINKTAELCAKTIGEETEFHAIWSNQCIELWFLLHFSFFHADIHRKDYAPKLTQNLKAIGQGKYSKNRLDMFQVLRSYMPDAISNAIKLENRNSGKQPADAAPGTKVYELIQVLQPYL